MEEQEEYQAGEQEPEVVSHCPVCEREWEPRELDEFETPPSLLILRFAGPGSAVAQVMGHGIVTREQVGAAIMRLVQDWAMPIMQMVAENTIAAFMEELTKPRIEPARGPMPPGPGFYMPPRGGAPL